MRHLALGMIVLAFGAANTGCLKLGTQTNHSPRNFSEEEGGGSTLKITPGFAETVTGEGVRFNIEGGQGTVTTAVFSGSGQFHPSGDFVASKTAGEVTLIASDGVSSVQATVSVSDRPVRKPDDNFYGAMWHLFTQVTDNSPADVDIDAEEGWSIRTDCSEVLVAVVDTGVDTNHPDLVANLWNNPDDPINGADDDNNGIVDDFYGANMIDGSGNPEDDNFHGTHVAGTIGAMGNNALGVTGVCWRAKIMSVKFLDELGGGTATDAIEAINYATDMGAKIVNHSWGGGPRSQAMFEAFEAAQDAGVLTIAAAGNDGENNDTTPHYPSNFSLELPSVLAVAALDDRDELTDFSNFGALSVDVAAPGGSTVSANQIVSTSPTSVTPGLTSLANDLTNAGIPTDPEDLTDYMGIAGTSMATPHVVGVATALKAQVPELTALQIKDRIIARGTISEALIGQTTSSRKINAYRTLLENAFEYPPYIKADPEDFTIDSSPQPGQTFNFRPTISNQGGRTAGALKLSYTISNETMAQVITAPEVTVGDVTSGARQTAPNVTIRVLPQTAPGTEIVLTAKWAYTDGSFPGLSETVEYRIEVVE